MIDSGSHTPGVRPEDFGLPVGTALRFELPSPALRPFFTDYHVLDSDGALHDGAVTWALPNWPAIRLIMTDAPYSLQIGSRNYNPLPRAALYGTTSRAMRITTHGGPTIGIGLTPLGWSRLFRISADSVRDQVIPLDQVFPADSIAALQAALHASDLGAGVKPLLDTFLGRQLGPPTDAEALIVALTRLMADDDINDIAAMVERVGVDAARLRRVSMRYFGFPPKPLLIRTRFIRSLTRMFMAGPKPNYSLIAPTYFDKSHFLRDANRFLGMTPRRFMKLDNPYLPAMVRARALVHAAAQVADIR